MDPEISDYEELALGVLRFARDCEPADWLAFLQVFSMIVDLEIKDAKADSE